MIVVRVAHNGVAPSRTLGLPTSSGFLCKPAALQKPQQTPSALWCGTGSARNRLQIAMVQPDYGLNSSTQISDQSNVIVQPDYGLNLSTQMMFVSELDQAQSPPRTQLERSEQDKTSNREAQLLEGSERTLHAYQVIIDGLIMIQAASNDIMQLIMESQVPTVPKQCTFTKITIDGRIIQSAGQRHQR